MQACGGWHFGCAGRSNGELFDLRLSPSRRRKFRYHQPQLLENSCFSKRQSHGKQLLHEEKSMTELPVTSNARPSNVVRFEQLMYLSLAIVPIQTFLQWGFLIDLAHTVGRGAGFILITQAFSIAVTLLFIWLIARRRKNWARWIWIILYIVGMLFTLPTLGRVLRNGPVVATLLCVQYLAQVVALYLIFTGNAREWFMSRVQSN